MGKGANKQLLTNSGVAQARSGTVFNQGQDVNSYLTPKLKAEADNPEGYSPQQMAYMNTAAQQSEGGAVGGITGQANLEAARTRNAGGFEGAVGEGSRTAQRDLSQKAVGIQKDQADLQQQQKQTAMSQLMHLYGVDESTAMGYLNTSNSALEGENKASGLNSLTSQYILGAQKAAASAAAAGG